MHRICEEAHVPCNHSVRILSRKPYPLLDNILIPLGFPLKLDELVTVIVDSNPILPSPRHTRLFLEECGVPEVVKIQASHMIAVIVSPITVRL
jgi:hypothetical protein